MNNNKINILKDKIRNYLYNKYCGKIRFQRLFEKIHFFTLLGYHTGPQGNIYESGEIVALKIISKKFSSNPVVFDIGANNGEYTNYLST